jgi:periplasmic protein TonB
VSGTRVTWFTLVIFVACATGSGVAALGQDHGGASVGPEQAGQQPQTLARVNLSAEAAQALMVSGVPPEYPKKARKKQIQGAVLLKILISPQGDVRDVTVESGDSLLASAATNAVKKWKYRPYLMRGRPVELESYVRVNFTLPGN